MPNDWASYTSAGSPPRLDPGMFNMPPGVTAKSARETKTDAFNKQFSGLLSTGTDYANYLTSEETRRYNLSNATLAAGAARFDKPSMTDEDIARQFSGYADKGAMDYSAHLNSLRTTLGGSGVTGGGWAGGQAGRFAAARMASLTDATRSLYEKRIESDMHDRADRWMAQQAVAAGQAREPSIVGLDWLGQAGTAMLSKYGTDTEASAAYHNQQAAKSAGTLGAIGQGLNAVGTIAGAFA